MSTDCSHSAFAVFRCRDFLFLTINQACLTFAVLIQEIVIAFQLYQITKNPLMLGLVGLMDFIPFLVLSLWGGYIADRFNRQRILQLSFSLAIPLSIALWICFDLFEHDHINANILLISTFGILFLFGCIRGIYSPCFNSLRPFIVPRTFICPSSHLDQHVLASMWHSSTSHWRINACTFALIRSV